MAVLVFLAGAAGAGVVAGDPAPGRGILGVDGAGRVAGADRRRGRGRGGRVLRAGVGALERRVLAGLVHFLRFILGEGLLRLRRHLQFDVGQHRGHPLAQSLQHLLEQVEGLALVFVERVLLGIGAQPDPLAQVIQTQQVLLPHLVEDLQQQALFDHAHDLGAVVGGLFRHLAVGGRGQPFADLGVGDAFLGRPVGQRQIQIEDP